MRSKKKILEGGNRFFLRGGPNFFIIIIILVLRKKKMGRFFFNEGGESVKKMVVARFSFLEGLQNKNIFLGSKFFFFSFSLCFVCGSPQFFFKEVQKKLEYD